MTASGAFAGRLIADDPSGGPDHPAPAPGNGPAALDSLEGRDRMTGSRPSGGPPLPTKPRTQRLPLPARPETAADARAFTAEFLADVTDPMVVADAVLLVSELVGNALRHTGEPGALFLTRTAGRLRIEVSDASPRPPLPRPPHRPDESGGLGLFLLSRLALRWGWHPSGPGKTVWCDLRLPAS
ncbi:ATP-binding protein [Kitasatospora sp. NPDC086801]|uniref:ATP-binding protein n=1 Tax=Kitasatospora sp. NPDC086801 TaxID=3364066 RepID=UPI0037F94E48